MNSALLIVLGLFLVVFQTMISNLVFSGALVLETSLVLVIYVGFSRNLVMGGLLSFLLGFFLDCFLGTVSGLFAFSYVICFLTAKFFSLRMYAERASFIMIMVGLCGILEGVMVMALYRVAYDVDKFSRFWDAFLPQAFLLTLVGPLLFKLFRHVEEIAASQKGADKGRNRQV